MVRPAANNLCRLRWPYTRHGFADAGRGISRNAFGCFVGEPAHVFEHFHLFVWHLPGSFSTLQQLGCIDRPHRPGPQHCLSVHKAISQQQHMGIHHFVWCHVVDILLHH